MSVCGLVVYTTLSINTFIIIIKIIALQHTHTGIVFAWVCMIILGLWCMGISTCVDRQQEDWQPETYSNIITAITISSTLYYIRQQKTLQLWAWISNIISTSSYEPFAWILLIIERSRTTRTVRELSVLGTDSGCSIIVIWFDSMYDIDIVIKLNYSNRWIRVLLWCIIIMTVLLLELMN